MGMLGVAAVGGCDSILGPGGDPAEPQPPITELPRELSAQELSLIGASNAFGFELLHRMAQADPEGSVVISPLSASMALGMTLNGADGATFEDMRATLGFGALAEEEINASYRSLIDLLLGLDSTVSTSLANSIWYRPDYTLVGDFSARMTDTFDAAIRPFPAVAPADSINRWVQEATGGRIEEIAPDPLPGNVVAYLINAVHFLAGWTRPFDPDDTHEAPFFQRDGTTAPVQMMFRDDTMSVHVTSEYAAVELPYGREAYAMTVVVPQGERTVHDLLAGLDEAAWAELVAGFGTQRAALWLPRFELEWEADLGDALRPMGMGVAFQAGAADFSRMFVGGGPWIDQVLQKTYIRVDEEGTEAAAVTAVIMTDSAPPSIRADRPFLFVIRERLSGTVLFAGVVVEAPEG
jgi:serine protease inhibitor